MPDPSDYSTVGMILLPSLRPLYDDEEAISLREDDRLIQQEHGERLMRVQTIRVRRGEKFVDFPRVMGPSKDYAAGPFLIPSLGAHCVGEIIDMAERCRRVLTKGLEEVMAEYAADFNVIEAAITQREMTRLYKKRNSRTWQRDSRKV